LAFGKRLPLQRPPTLWEIRSILAISSIATLERLLGQVIAEWFIMMEKNTKD
jgi:hypothetical protein